MAKTKGTWAVKLHYLDGREPNEFSSNDMPDSTLTIGDQTIDVSELSSFTLTAMDEDGQPVLQSDEQTQG